MSDSVGPYDDPGLYESASSGGLRRRFAAGGGQPGRVPSSRAKRLRYPPHERARRIPAGKQARAAASRKRAAEPNVRGNHHAHKTEKPPKGQQGNLHAPHGQAKVPEPVRHAIVGQTGLSWSPLSGQAFGHSLHAFHYLLGHHPQADGRVHSPASKHQGHTRRGTILSYSSGTNTAVVRFGDTPDSPTVSIPVSPVITSAVIGSATMAQVQLWDDSDPTDALITAVL